MYVGLGYSIEQTPYTGDFGIDIYAYKDGIKYAIECKAHKVNKIGHPILQKFCGAMIDAKATMGIMVAFQFTRTAHEYVKGKNIQLVDLDMLVMLMHKAFDNFNDDDSIRIMCRRCGEIVEFRQDDELKKRCGKGHTVRNDLTKLWLY